MKGSVIDLAVGVVIGAAFGKIVDSLVNDIIMPIVGILIGGYDFSKLAVKVGEAEIKYGNFIQISLNFVIIAFVLFMVIKAMNKMKRERV
jgi:large conductance mechanosensitive channel